MAMDIVRDYPLLVGALALIVLGAGLGLWQLQQRLLRSEHERRRAAEELNRRLSELFSLQELSYVLSDSLELDRIVEQVVRYAVRFLDARGALLALVGDTGAAGGALYGAGGAGRAGAAPPPRRDPLDWLLTPARDPTSIVHGSAAAAAAAVPLRSHGTVI